jgi:hypothetical protein
MAKIQMRKKVVKMIVVARTDLLPMVELDFQKDWFQIVKMMRQVAPTVNLIGI